MNIRVVVGAHDLKQVNDDNKYKVKGVTTPYNGRNPYQGGQAWYDYAIVLLERPLTYSAKVSPICLPAPDSGNYVGKMITLTGWGATNQAKTKYPNLLQVTTLKVISDKECEERKHDSFTYNSR